MSASPAALDALLQRADLWRGGACAHHAEATLGSGFAALDAVLPDGGWPCGGLTEVLAGSLGIGELSLFLPALRQLEAEAGWVVVVAPPAQLHAPAWQALGLPLSRLLVVEAEGADAAWACEQLLGSGALAALLAWLPSADARTLRRLQLASSNTRCLSLVFRPERFATQPSPAPLRLALRGSDSGLQVDILKRRGPPLAKPLCLNIERPLPWSRLTRRAPTAAPVRREPHVA